MRTLKYEIKFETRRTSSGFDKVYCSTFKQDVYGFLFPLKANGEPLACIPTEKVISITTITK